MRVAGYCRVSSADQVERLSLATQERLLREYCARQGWPEPIIYVDAGKSAYNDDIAKRPQLAALVLAVQGGAHEALLVYDLDRLARNAVIQLTLAQQLAKAGCRLISLNQSTDLATPEGKMMYTFNAGINEFYSAQISRKSRAGLAHIRALGGHVGGVPYGARRDAARRLEVDPARADTLALLLTLVAQGSYAGVATELNRRGLPPPKSAPFWQPTSVTSIVRSGRWLLDQPAPWPALWSAAATRPRLPRTNRHHQARELSGLLRCACGGTIVYGAFNTLRDGTRVLRLQCRRFTATRPAGSGCPYPKRNARHYEAEATRQLLAMPDLTTVDLATPDVRAARARIQERRLNLARAVARGLPDDEADLLQREIDAAELALPLDSGTEQTLAEELRLIQWLWPDEDAAWRNAAWRRVALRIVVSGPDIRVEWLPPLQRLYDHWRRERGPGA